MKISYMKVWPKRHGSPFDRGDWKTNFRFFLTHKFSRGKNLYPWVMPRKLPKHL